MRCRDVSQINNFVLHSLFSKAKSVSKNINKSYKATYHNLWPDLKLSTNHPSVDAMAPMLQKVLFDVDKARIEDCIVSMSHGAISHSLSIPRRTVSNFIAHLKNRGIRVNLQHPGQPRITTTAQNKCIIAAAETHMDVPLAELWSITNMNISKSTIRQQLHEV